MKIKVEEIRYTQKQAELNETHQLTSTFISALPNATQELIKAEQKKEKDVLVRTHFDQKVKLYLQRYSTSTANHTAEF
jgi:hypothetical protein